MTIASGQVRVPRPCQRVFTAMSNSIDTSALLGQMRAMAREAGVPGAGLPVNGFSASSAATGATQGLGSRGVGTTRRAGGLDALAGSRWSEDLGTVDTTVRRGENVVFTDLFRRSVEGVNARSKTSTALAEAFESGASDVELADVMIAVQKARISFEALVQVRNKMIAAYKDIMSTPL